MTTLTLRLPDDTHARLKELARYRGVSLNRLMEELATIAVAQHDAETRFRALVADGSVDMGLDVLDKLDHTLREGDAAPAVRPRTRTPCYADAVFGSERTS